MIHRLTPEEWHAEGVDRFGTPDWKRWFLVCPSCGQVQSAKDFADLGKPELIIMATLGYSCVGWLRRVKKGHQVVKVGEKSKGHGCEYRGGHPPWISPKVIMFGDAERPTFDWAEETDDV